jgi:hypothetical protein
MLPSCAPSLRDAAADDVERVLARRDVEERRQGVPADREEQAGDDEQREVLGSEHRGLIDAGASVSGLGR